MADRLSAPLQESVLTLLAMNNTEGRIAAALLKPTDFDEDYRVLADRCIKFHKKHGSAPGQSHLDDLLDVEVDKKHKRHKMYMRVLDGILSNADSLNAGYVLSRIHEFARKQALKSAILEAGEIYQTGRESVVQDVEAVLSKALRSAAPELDIGSSLGDRRTRLDFLHSQHADYMTGIPELDRRNMGPTRGEMLILMAAKGAGKSWWAIDLGKKCWMQNARVLHVSLEMSEARVKQRYVQNLFALGKRMEPYLVTEFEIDKAHRIIGWDRKKHKARMSLDSPRIERYLNRKLRPWGTRLGRIMIKSFPMKSLSVQKLQAYLDLLELRERFIPDVLIVDYPDLLWMDKKDPRISLGWAFEELRGLLQERNMAGICPTQTNRKGWDAETVKGSMVAEDASKFRTADMVLIYSRSKMEKELGLGRLFVEKNRNDEGDFTVVVSQSYATGQFVLSSSRMHSSYWDLIKVSDEERDDGDEEG